MRVTSPLNLPRTQRAVKPSVSKWANWDKVVTRGHSLLLVSRVSSPDLKSHLLLTSSLQAPALRTQTFKRFLGPTTRFSHVKHVSAAVDFKTESASIRWLTHKGPAEVLSAQGHARSLADRAQPVVLIPSSRGLRKSTGGACRLPLRASTRSTHSLLVGHPPTNGHRHVALRGTITLLSTVHLEKYY